MLATKRAELVPARSRRGAAKRLVPSMTEEIDKGEDQSGADIRNAFRTACGVGRAVIA
jgi:hypothetical protein